MIYVANKKRGIKNIKIDFPNALILDITSSSPYKSAQKLSPFYPHGNIPIPGDSHGLVATCVEGIWQGLKVFEHCGIDTSVFQNNTMKGLKRTVRKYGKPLGHQYGVFSKEILCYADAKRLIYIPSYKYVLDHNPDAHRVIERIREKSKESDIVLLDYNINIDNREAAKPLSHAELVKMYLEGRYPSKPEDFIPYEADEIKKIKQQQKKAIKSHRNILSKEDIVTYDSKIHDIIKVTPRTTKEIIQLLHVDILSKDLSSYLKKQPGIKIQKIKGKNYFYINLEETPSLF